MSIPYIVLVDTTGTIRNYYDFRDAEQIKRLIEHTASDHASRDYQQTKAPPGKRKIVMAEGNLKLAKRLNIGAIIVSVIVLLCWWV